MAEADADNLAITGGLDFDDVPVEAGSKLVLTLTDFTNADPEAALISEQIIDIEDSASPIAFAITVPRSDLDPTLRYALLALVTDASGTALLTTNSANFVDVEAETSDLGTLSLVSAA